MLRRHFNLALLAAWAAGCAPLPARAREPLLWVAQRGRSRVYVLGFGEVRDQPWLTPNIERAFDASSELWLETTPDPPPPELVKALAYDPTQTFFDALRPEIRERANAYVNELGIDRTAIEGLRPWAAYYRINTAFWAKHKVANVGENPDQVLRARAQGSGKRIEYEFPDPEALIRFFASMPAAVQDQYIEMLLDYLDDEKRGANADHAAWVEGKPSSRALDRMRTRTPQLYRYIQADRNAWWARHIDQLLATSGTRFVALGMNHLLGVDGVPAQLKRMGVEIGIHAVP